MKTEQLDYELPAELIAQHPADVRSDSRLLVLQRPDGRIVDSRFSHLGEFLQPGDCLALNDTKVLPARFFARRQTGGRLEALFLHVTAQPDVWLVMLKGVRKVKPGETLLIRDKKGRDFCDAEMVEKKPDGVCLLRIGATTGARAVLDEVGFPPLPPYIRRDDDPASAEEDRRRYQTVYARRPGAVAAPTAGLHFTDDLLRRLRDQGIRLAYVTLHVGAGTFKPISTEHVEDHPIHRESYSIDEANADVINGTRRRGGRVIAVGTTVTRVLETVSSAGAVQAGSATTGLFITPGYAFNVIDAMITNFHLPRSTLLALVAAFAGLDNIRRAYRHAIDRRYRFYSYGDATLIL